VARAAEERTVVCGLVALAFAGGALLRVAAYLRDRSLWVDEAMLGLNIITRRLSELTKPLDFGQSAPPGFLWIERAAVSALGTSEQALRLPLLIAGLLVLVAVARVAWTAISPQAAVVCTALCASSGELEYYSNELKPYGSDALATMALLMLALRLRSGTPRMHLKVLTCTAALLIPWISLPSVFVLGAIGLLALGRRRDRSSGPWLATLTGVGIASWLLSLVIVHDAALVSLMKEYWGGMFGDPGYFRQGTANMVFAVVLGRGSWNSSTSTAAVTLVGLALLVLGAGSLLRRDRELGVLLLGPLVAGVAAYVAGQYPYGNRLWTFALPLIALAFGEGLQAAAAIVPSHVRDAALLAAGGLLWLPSAKFAAYQLRSPGAPREDARPAFAELRSRRHGEPVYVYARALPAWLYYARGRYPVEELRAILREASPPRGSRLFMNSKIAILLNGSSDTALVRRHAEGTDLLGTASGYHREVNRPVTGAGNRRWASQEAGRMALAATRGCVWTFEAHLTPGETAVLEEQLAGLGFGVTDRITGTVNARRWCRAVEAPVAP
jgi:hypothetical protein